MLQGVQHGLAGSRVPRRPRDGAGGARVELEPLIEDGGPAEGQSAFLGLIARRMLAKSTAVGNHLYAKG
jgi:hypothetical protein